MLLNLASAANAHDKGGALGLHPPLCARRRARRRTRNSTRRPGMRCAISRTSCGRRSGTGRRTRARRRRSPTCATGSRPGRGRRMPRRCRTSSSRSATTHGFDPLRAWFAAIYEVLLGAKQGPRFGGFIARLRSGGDDRADRCGAGGAAGCGAGGIMVYGVCLGCTLHAQPMHKAYARRGTDTRVNASGAAVGAEG